MKTVKGSFACLLRNSYRLFSVGCISVPVILAASLLGTATSGYSSMIVSYEFTWPGNTDDLFKPTQTTEHISATEYDFYSDASSQKGWEGSGGNPGAVFYAATTVLSTEAYTFFSLTIDEGYSLDLESLKFDSKRNVNSATAYDVKYSTDAVDFVSIGSGDLSGTAYEEILANNDDIQITGLTGTVDFRIYGSGWSGPADDDQRWYHDNVQVIGSVIPEPSSVLLLIVGTGGLMAWRRKRMNPRSGRIE